MERTYGDDRDGTYPEDDRTWKKRDNQAQTRAYEGKAPKAEKEAREERVPMAGMRGRRK